MFSGCALALASLESILCVLFMAEAYYRWNTMSRTLRKAVEVVKQRKDTELNIPDEGIANLEDVPELCELYVYTTCTSLKLN